jgi:hypothetical protein
MRRWHLLASVVMLLAATAYRGEELAAQQGADADLVDRLLIDGWGADHSEAMRPCEDGNGFLEELFSRDLSEVQTRDVSQRFRLPWTLCPSEALDNWLVSELLKQFAHADRPAPQCSFDCPNFLSSLTENLLWDALLARRSPQAFDLWLQVAEFAPSPLVEGEALLAAAQSLSPDERLAFFLDIYERPNLPGLIAVGQAYGMASLLVVRGDASQLIDLADVPAARNLIDGIGILATGQNNATRAMADSALVILEAAIPLSASGPRLDQIRNWAHDARVSRLVSRMTRDERISFYISGLEGSTHPPRYGAAEPGWLMTNYPTEFLAAVAPELLATASGASEVSSLISVIGFMAGQMFDTSFEDADAAMTLLEGALALSDSGTRRTYLVRIIEVAWSRRSERLPVTAPRE